MSRPVILLELNELCPPLLERFMADGDLPAFTRLRDESIVYVTRAHEEQNRLNPWIQWVTAHTGLGFDEHGVFKLGEGSLLEAPTIADVLGAAGQTVWLCGPMNVVPVGSVRGRWLPDPWNPDPAATSPELAPFAEFVRANVQEHTNPGHRLTLRSYARFLWFMVTHGLSLGTVRATVGQLVGERIRRVPRYKRAALLDRFQWDVFRHFAKRDRPALATYFSNTTAHYQHMYWRYMDPEAFELAPSSEEVDVFGDAIRSGYVEMDRIVANALALADAQHATLVFCTAISQQPYVLKDDEGGSRFYRPHDIESFVASLQLDGVERVAPVMAAQFHVFFRDESTAEAAARLLGSAMVGDLRAFSVHRVGADILLGFAPTADLPDDAVIDLSWTGGSIRIADVFYRSETAKSGYHHPDGALWIRTSDRRSVTVADQADLRAVAPTVLALLSVEPPPTMRVPALATDASVAARP